MVLKSQDLDAENKFHRAQLLCFWREIALCIRQLLISPSSTGKADSDKELKISHLKLFAFMPASQDLLKEFFNAYELSLFETLILFLCMATEVEPNISELCAKIQGSELPHPTVNLALKLLPQPSWSAFNADSPLLRWQFIHLQEARPFTLSPLSIDRPIFFYLLGENYVDPHLKGFIQPFSEENTVPLTPSQKEIAASFRSAWDRSSSPSAPPIFQLYGNDSVVCRAIAQAACQLDGRPLYRASLSSFAPHPGSTFDSAQLKFVASRWQRAARLTNAVLLLECHDVDLSEPTLRLVLKTLLSELKAPLVLSADERVRVPEIALRTIEVPPPNYEERKAIWKATLGDRAPDRALEAIADFFALPLQDITAICDRVPEGIESPGDLAVCLWHGCRHQARARLDAIAQRVETPLTWQDLILPDECMQLLESIVATTRNRFIVHHQRGFVRKSERGLGLCALFAGQSGTGKTTAAEIIAKTLGLDCYRVDLSTIVSKYVGETEKNLKQIFDAADAGGVVLLFDEADALFGKRGEVKEARDRYANMEVSYLLQRIETYRGLAILTTNLKQSIDDAFLRRLSFIVKFPFPDAAQRERIWRRAFPEDMPVEDLDYKKLAKLSVAGGNIRNITISSAFMATDAEGPVTMAHLLEAARQEYVKLERNLPESEVRGWVKEGEDAFERRRLERSRTRRPPV